MCVCVCVCVCNIHEVCVCEQYSIKNESYGLTSEYDVWRKFVEDEKPIYAFGMCVCVCVCVCVCS